MSSAKALLDPAISGLCEALDAQAMTARLARLPDGGGEVWTVAGIDVIKYKPGRRCALAYTLLRGGETRRLFAKVFSGDRGATILVSMGRIAAAIPRERLLVPRPLAYFPDLKMLVTEFVDGIPLATALFAEPSDAAARRMASALATLHACGIVGARRWTLAKELRSTGEWIEGLAGRSQAASRRAGALLERLAGWAATLAAVPDRPVHRDFYPDQLWDHDGQTAMLDLDDARCGDPAVDIGNFLAHLTLRPVQFAETALGAARARPAFEAHYLECRAEARADATFAERVRFYEASSLLRLSGVYSARDHWAASVPPVLLDACADILSSKGV